MISINKHVLIYVIQKHFQGRKGVLLKPPKSVWSDWINVAYNRAQEKYNYISVYYLSIKDTLIPGEVF